MLKISLTLNFVHKSRILKRVESSSLKYSDVVTLLLDLFSNDIINHCLYIRKLTNVIILSESLLLSTPRIRSKLIVISNTD